MFGAHFLESGVHFSASGVRFLESGVHFSAYGTHFLVPRIFFLISGCPWSLFVAFRDHFGYYFQTDFEFVRKRLKSKYKSTCWSLYRISFPIKFPSTCRHLPETPSWMILLRIQAHVGTKFLLLGSSLAPGRVKIVEPRRMLAPN